MDNAIYIGLSYQTALQRQLDVIANNMANLNTTGFKGEHDVFSQFLDKPPHGSTLSMVQDVNTTRDLREGPIETTNNTLDFALQGEGYFTVETLNGPRYTRTGSFELDNAGEIVTPEGLPVLDTQNRRITIPATASEINVTSDGIVSTNLGQLATLKISGFTNQVLMQPLPDGLYDTTEAPVAATARVVQGALEGSNVEGVVEMTRMTEVTKHYQIAQNMLDSENTRQKDAIDNLAKVQ
ncbi:MAG: flagellar hook-basal body complex protein [Azospirillaceae bacterium]|nr:flagellar hook-basal body complex protein [Azospirillaceae bacterium]